MKNKDTFLDKVTRAVAWFMGSWWAVLFHTSWFTIWLIFNFNIDTLTLWVSLEAIFIGIFLLMASNRAEVARDRVESLRQIMTKQKVIDNLDENLKQSQKLDRVIQVLYQLQDEIDASEQDEHGDEARFNSRIVHCVEIQRRRSHGSDYSSEGMMAVQKVNTRVT